VNALDRIRERARRSARRVVLPEAALDERILLGARIAADRGWARPLLLGDIERISALAKSVAVPLNGLRILDHRRDQRRGVLAQRYLELRAPKEKLDAEAAIALMDDPLFFGAMLVRQGEADGMTAGAAHATRDVLRAALRCVGLREGIATLSSVFIMVFSDDTIGDGGSMIFADCGVVPDPDERQLADIAVSSAQTAEHLLGLEPRVAMLSFSTRGSAEAPSVAKVRAATALARSAAPKVLIDGELQADAAIVQAVAQRKSPGSGVAGRANILVFPDLNAGNIGYKLVERLAKARAVGPILQGLAKPVNDLSRGASPEDIADVIAVTAAQVEAPMALAAAGAR
jgi:phosphate acetyltransferase